MIFFKFQDASRHFKTLLRHFFQDIFQNVSRKFQEIFRYFFFKTFFKEFSTHFKNFSLRHFIPVIFLMISYHEIMIMISLVLTFKFL